MLTFHIITLFPEAFDSYLGVSIIKRALKKRKIAVRFYNPRDFSRDKHRRVDDRPYGGGPGMALSAEPILRAVEKARGRKKGEIKVFITSPRGRQFAQSSAGRIATTYSHVIIICGHYEGIDARVKKVLRAEEVSIGPYTLTGGEVPALVMIDAIARHLPGVVGKQESLEEKRVASGEVYTRPEILEWKGRRYRVPAVLRSGDHAKIEEWRKHA